MPCAEYENRLLDQAGLNAEERDAVDAHLDRCAGCRAFLEALERVDAALAAELGHKQVTPAFRRAVLARISRPSFLPEVLDFVGWAGVFAMIGGVALAINGYALWAAAAAFLTAGLWAGLRSYAELRR
ncbi:MAG: zf-HC2 domain-containing protein [Acidobacteriota bacterium]